MMQEIIQWLDAQNIDYTTIDNEVVEIPNFGKMFLADLSSVESIFKSKDGDVRFNLMENPQDLQDEGIFYVAFPFGNNWYFYDLREEFRFNILKHIRYYSCLETEVHRIAQSWTQLKRLTCSSW